MTNSINKKGWASLLCFVLAAALVLSCTKNDDAGSSKVILLSFGPSGAKHGDTITFIGNNLNRVTAVQLTGAMVPSTAFTEYTTERIRFVIPLATQEGFVTLKTPDGDIVSKTKINFTVTAKITSVTKEAKPGSNITIKGEFLNWVKEVRFAKDIAETTFVSRSLTELVVKVPAGAESGTLFISNGGSKPITIETDSVLIVTMPVVDSIRPNPVAPGSDLTISGKNLEMVSAVTFTGVTAPVKTFVSQSGGQLVLKVPDGALKGRLTLSVTNSTRVVETGVLDYIGSLPPLADLAFPIYTDALQNGFQDWSYTDIHDFSSTTIVRQGNNSIKAVYGTNGYQGLTFHAGTAASTAGYTKFELSVFGTAGTGGKNLNIVLNGDYATTYPLTIAEGEWKTVSFNLSALGNPASIGEIVLQSAGWSGTVYIDHVGLR